jgi:hypothetical protein
MAGVNVYAERALYILQCAEKERDELQYRIDKSAQNDAIRITGPSMLRGYAEKINQARKNAMEAGASVPMPSATLNAKETDRILRMPKK